jgi:magnesium and cobalt transporter
VTANYPPLVDKVDGKLAPIDGLLEKLDANNVVFEWKNEQRVMPRSKLFGVVVAFVGILLAKDLLRFYTDEDFDLRDMLRPAVFIPESKRLNVLLRDFRVNRNHIAIVVDEYGGVAGLITIEDVLEQIVGDIEDEYDFDQEEDNILATADGHMRVRGLTEISQFNDAFGTHFSDEDVDTIGGLLANHLGRVPHRGEKIVLGTFQFDVLRADARQVQMVLVRRLTASGGDASAGTSSSNPA